MSPRRLAAWAAAALLVPLAALARVLAHPEALRDGEGAIPWTIGRELALCGVEPVLHYQVIPYQGCLIVDSLASGALYATLGDHLLSGYGVGLGWAWVTAAAGAAWLDRAVGPRAAAVWLALLVSAPLIWKEAFAAVIGGHVAAPAFGLVAGALLAGEERPRVRAVLAGAAVGFGAWYVRTAVLAAPLVLGMAKRRGVLLVAVAGLSLGPALIVGNAAALRAVDAAVAQGDLLPFVQRTALPSAERTASAPLLDRTAQASGWALRRGAYARPGTVTGDGRLPTAGAAAGIAWTATTALAGLALLPLAARRGELRAPLAFAATFALVLLWRLPPLPLELVQQLGPGPIRVSPPPNPIRYLAPLAVVQTFAAAAALGTHRRAPLLALPAIVLGLLASADDAASPDPRPPLRQLSPAWYSSLHLNGREPPADVLTGCDTDDPDSLAFRQALLGQGAAQFLVGPSGIDPQALLEFADAQTGSRAQQLAAWEGAAPAAAEQARAGISTPEAFLESLPAALGALRQRDPEAADRFAAGLIGAFPEQWLQDDRAGTLARVCVDASVCRAMGSLTADAGGALPAAPGRLFALSDGDWGALPEPTRRNLLRGAAEGLAERPIGPPVRGEGYGAWPEAEAAWWDEAR